MKISCKLLYNLCLHQAISPTPAPESLIRASCALLRLNSELIFGIYVEGATLVLPSRLFMLNKYWRILALS